ncbi:MAG: polyphosphate polymerase domain-containing protein [Chitinispirillales bacterium]|jgi:hypothetical protein|nr:polyphosphate polymerase domain-containing protein [Chitinispirillales bacterium]
MMEKWVLDCLQPFSRSSLKDAKAMAFLNRFDTKFILRIDGVPDFLENIREDYSVLQIYDVVGQSYETVYFDTPDLLCFNMHHNKRARRFKFRTRQYLTSGHIFNEIKQKQNTGKTKKYRQRRDELGRHKTTPPLPLLRDLTNFDDSFADLLRNNGFFFDDLRPSLTVYFDRITFLNKKFSERMTLDLGLKYRHDGMEWSLGNTAIIELKRERGPERTVSQKYLRKIHREPSGFSKYAIGISLTRDNVKKNRFLPRLRKIAYERSAA